jgi:HTH-type transcriptional regulator / antitoxin HipB
MGGARRYFGTITKLPPKRFSVPRIWQKYQNHCARHSSAIVFGNIAKMKFASMIITDPSELGAFLRKRREALEIAQGDLASIAGIDQGNLSKIERGGAKATLETYLRLCKALGIALVAEPRA